MATSSSAAGAEVGAALEEFQSRPSDSRRRPSTGESSQTSDHDTDEQLSPSHSHSHQESVASQTLAPLEHALTPNIETQAERDRRLALTRTKTGTSIATTGSRIPSFEVDFAENDPEDPRNWPLWYRGVMIGCVSFATWVVVLYSTSYTSSMPGMMEEFHVKSQTVATLGVTVYLLGLACGSLVLAPLSEIYGRRPVYTGTLLLFILMVLPSALATSLPEVLVVRFFAALFGAAMIANAPGTVSDIASEEYRALAFSIWSIGPMNAPVTGPIIGGFTAEYLGWRWTNWLVMILGGVGWLMCSALSETYAPRLLQRKAARLRKETGDDRWWSRYDQKASVFQILKTNLSRPFILSFTEPILWFWNAYIAIIYAILYLCFVAFPFIYSGLRGWSLGFTGLAFLGICVGTMLAIITEPLARKLINSHKKDPATGKVPPEAAISIVCFASILCPIGQLWFSWTSVPITIHWIWPIMAGIPFGAGNCLVFIYASNYIAGSYGVYAASALAGNSVVRSIIGGALPLAGPTMYRALTPQWAGTLLGLVQVVLIPIPFIFYKYGDRIRARSPLIKQMRADQERSQKRADKSRRRQERQDRLTELDGVAESDDVEKQAASRTVEPVTFEKD